MISPVVANRNILTSNCSAIWFARGVGESGSAYQHHKVFLGKTLHLSGCSVLTSIVYPDLSKYFPIAYPLRFFKIIYHSDVV